MSQSTADRYIFVREGTTYTRLPLGEILFIEADGNYSKLHTPDKRYTIKRSVSAISSELDPAIFTQVARGTLVNFNRVSTISFAEGRLEVEGRPVKIGKSYHAAIKERMPRL